MPAQAAMPAQAVRSGDITAAEVLQQHLDAIERSESDIHAFNLVTTEQAFADAAAVDETIASGKDPGPLAGVPVAYKDNICTRAIPTTCSSKMLDGWRPPYDATVVERLRAAGAVMVGKTNLDEFAMGSSTENSAFGPTANPRDLTRVPGGSSGGSAAAVAAGFAPLALGSDTGGSIRQPAALCGVVGVKPTYGRVSRYGLVAFASSFDQIGPLTNTVADAATAFEVLAGHDPADSTSIPEPAPDCTSMLERGVEGLRVGVVSELLEDANAGGAAGINADVAERIHIAADALQSAGAKLGKASVPAVTYGLTAYYLIAPAEASSNLARFDGTLYGLRVRGGDNASEVDDVEQMNLLTRRQGFGEEVIARIMLGTYALTAGYYDAYYAKAQRLRTLTQREFAAAYADFDVLLAPTSPSVAFPFGDRADPMLMYRCDTCTIPSNLTGDPAMSVPFGTGEADLPVGVQVLAPALGEPLMFQVAAELERLAEAELAPSESAAQ